MKIATFIRKVAIHVLADRDCSLLSIDYFETTIVAYCPIHHVEWVVVKDGVDYRSSLFVLVDKLSVLGGANVEFA